LRVYWSCFCHKYFAVWHVWLCSVSWTRHMIK
jgi:hypothetical protein